MEYTKEYYVEMHRKMWNIIYELIKEEIKDFTDKEKKEYIDDIRLEFIYDMKVKALAKMFDEKYELPDSKVMEEKYHYCFACLYAFSKENVNAKKNRLKGGKYCKSCPLKWEKSNRETFQCCGAQYGDIEHLNFSSIDNLLKLVKEIAELPVQEDV